MKVKYVVLGAVLLILALIGGFWLMLDREREQFEREKEELAQLQKEAMQEELDNLSDEYEHQYNKLTLNGRETSFNLTNDSLIRQLNGERAKVDRLLEELNQVKTTNAARIAQLSREVGTLRKVLKTYVVQIDSLHAANQRLREENKAVKADFQRATSEVRQLVSQRSELADKVTLAAKLDATAIHVAPLDKKGKATKKIGRVETLQVSFRVAKNITAEVGVKTFYARLVMPNDEVMLKAGAGNFSFEGKSIPFSMRREVEYNGEETPIVMYWNVEEALQPGAYRLMLFESGNLIGSHTFSL